LGSRRFGELSDLDPRVEIIELHEEFVQNIELGSTRIRNLSILTMAVAFLLFVLYLDQLLIPIVTGEQLVTVNLRDPVLIVTEIVLLVLTFAWLYVGAINFLFSRKMNKAIRIARIKEMEIEARIEKGTAVQT
jgi:preprotein translocase subunit SecE